MFDQLIDPPSLSKHAAAAEFFMSLKKEAEVRSEARRALRRMADTNTFTIPSRILKSPPTKSAVVPVMKKQAFIGEAIRAVAHSAQGPAAAAAKSLRQTRKLVGQKIEQQGRAIGQSREAFKAGFTMKDPNFMQRLFSRFKKGSGFGTMQEGRFIPIKSKVIFGQETTPGSEVFLRRLAKKKGTAYADAFRMGRGVKKGVDPDMVAGGARHFVTSRGDFTPASVIKGMYTTGLANPETTQKAIRSIVKNRLARPKPSLSERTGISNSRLMLGGGTAAGLGYLALRPNKTQAR